ncbi:alpha/beta hydrolase family protein [Streptomyces hygroscopicus]|uniref:alpha/beta hydrolase n=1 Tax=Streptomyces TaxID=1883 RepID=UPI00209FFCE6|nr:alpha/beta hydrolase family protein [Streptomyces sp. RKCA744]MCO8305335.1 esterase family protein [Streptomyces sp. RKCA744]
MPNRRRAVAALTALAAAPLLPLPAEARAAEARAAGTGSSAGRSPEALSGSRTPAHARLVAADRVSERVLDLTIDSPALGREGHARVLLPTGYDRRPHRRWPVLYLLHGCCDPGPGWEAWTLNTDVEGITADTPALIVSPEGGPVGFYSDWWNGGRYGRPAWETFHLAELRPLLERALRANGRRAIAGLSMGGFGALSYAARHPRLFHAAASFSGVVHTTLDPAGVQGILTGGGADPTALWGDPAAQSPLWDAHNPYALIPRLPRGYPVYLSCGNGAPGPLDPPDRPEDTLERGLGEMAGRYARRARGHGLAVTARLYGPGTHTWPYWERELARALPLLTAPLI